MKCEVGFNTCLGFIGWFVSDSPTLDLNKFAMATHHFLTRLLQFIACGVALKNHTSTVVCTKCHSLIIGQHYSPRADYTRDLVSPLLSLDFHMQFKILV